VTHLNQKLVDGTNFFKVRVFSNIELHRTTLSRSKGRPFSYAINSTNTTSLTVQKILTLEDAKCMAYLAHDHSQIIIVFLAPSKKLPKLTEKNLSLSEKGCPNKLKNSLKTINLKSQTLTIISIIYL